MNLFPFLLALHIAAGCLCLVTGLIAMASRKRKGRHTAAGELYHGSFVVILFTSVAMALLHWSTSAYLFYIGIFSYSFAAVGYFARKRRVRNWLGLHIGGMLGSYIAIITAVLVVNSPHIPLLSGIPPLWLWFAPTIVGSPLIFLVGRKYKKSRPKAR
ncbi:alcohol dehydrogenase [Gordoniibacillus kamchatkensis]|uniref:Alcohol dehydrogenase n=1 Tax=Gordoniibacillus kamchatkensis TaxID=1590651 RepID=A0ABR5AED2_9BACL|nr:hypothetical protein [Paenibacillus sp. VKM B-2647]KIL39406.1 alcohol dehydrogenase [Paenibacillus sp. VKM B-2647]